MSKKWSAGSTHVIIDLPYGPNAKLKDEQEAHTLGKLFEYVAAGLGLHVKAMVTDGSSPIGRGIGPALEVRDVKRVLDNDPDAPADLREKALRFAAEILAWAPSVGTVSKGRQIAESLLSSGRARSAFESIVDSQGRRAPPVSPARYVQTVVAQQEGIVSSIDGWAISGIARKAGAPTDLGAGVDLLAAVGQQVEPGDGLFHIYGADEGLVSAAALLAQTTRTHDICIESMNSLPSA